MKTITKEHLAEQISQQIGLPKTTCEEILEKYFDTIFESAQIRKKVSVRKLGNFYISEKSARPGMDINNNKAIIIASRKNFCFNPARSLKEKIKFLDKN